MHFSLQNASLGSDYFPREVVDLFSCCLFFVEAPNQGLQYQEVAMLPIVTFIVTAYPDI